MKIAIISLKNLAAGSGSATVEQWKN